MNINVIEFFSLIKELITSADKMEKFREITSDIKELICDVKTLISTIKD